MKNAFITVFILLLLPVCLGLESNDVTVYGVKADFCEGYFRDFIEHAVFFTSKGFIFTFTTYEEESVSLPIWVLEEELGKVNCEIKDLTYVVHNHCIRGSPKFSYKDRLYFWTLYRRGFRGAFALYHQPSGEVTDIIWGYQVENNKKCLQEIKREIVLWYLRMAVSTVGVLSF